MKRILITALGVAALALSACGGPSASEKYTKAVNGDVQKTGTALITAAQQVNASSSSGDYHGALSSQANALRSLASALQQVKPPGSVSAAHAALVSEVSNYAREVESSKTPADLVANTKLAVGRIKADIAQINGAL